MRKYFLICLFAMVTGILNAQEVKSGVAQDSLACDTVISLDGVDVVARRATVKMIGHSIVVDVEHDSILNRQNDIYEMLQKTPGIIRTRQGIMVAGKGAPIYYINGRKVREQSQLDNLQVDQVKSVQVYLLLMPIMRQREHLWWISRLRNWEMDWPLMWWAT